MTWAEFRGWLDDAAPFSHRSRVQSVMVGIMLRRDLWAWGVERYKGTLTLSAGPIVVEIGG